MHGDEGEIEQEAVPGLFGIEPEEPDHRHSRRPMYEEQRVGEIAQEAIALARLCQKIARAEMEAADDQQCAGEKREVKPGPVHLKQLRRSGEAQPAPEQG